MQHFPKVRGIFHTHPEKPDLPKHAFTGNITVVLLLEMTRANPNKAKLDSNLQTQTIPFFEKNTPGSECENGALNS